MPASFMILALLMSAVSASLLQIEIAYPVLQRALAEQLFTDEGRLYLRANRAAKCSFAYLERPEVSGENGKLRIRATFTGRSAMDLFGRCLGMGDSFSITILATPYYNQSSLIALREISINSDRDSIYIRAVRTSMRDSLQRDFRYDIAKTARRLIEQSDPNVKYRTQVASFRVEDIRPDVSGLVVKLALSLRIH